MIRFSLCVKTDMVDRLFELALVERLRKDGGCCLEDQPGGGSSNWWIITMLETAR